MFLGLLSHFMPLLCRRSLLIAYGQYHYYDINESVYLEIWEGQSFEFTVYGDMNDETICKYKNIVTGISYQAEINDFQLKDIPEFVNYCRKVVSSVRKKIA